MREKRLRKQEMIEEASSSSRAQAKGHPSQTISADGTLKRMTPTIVTHTPPGSSSPSSSSLVPDITLSAQNGPASKLIPLKSKVASPLNSTTVTFLTTVPVRQSSSPQQGETRSQSPNKVPGKNTRSSTAHSPAKQARAVPQGPPAESSTANKTHTADSKGTYPHLS